jgi:glycosyltransferase involved in cell wall biosynthesis
MRIAYFNANLKFGQDGVTRVVYKMIEGVLERGHEAIAITSILPELSQQTIPMYKVPSVVIPLHKEYRIAVPGYQSFAGILEEFRPDILHINSPCTLGFGAVKYAKHFDVPVVATYHTHFPTYPRYFNLTRLEDLVWRITRNLYNSIDRTLVPSMPILQELTENNILRLQYLPNGVDTGLFTPERRNNSWRAQFGGGSKPIVLFVSRLVWEKDLRVLAHAYQQLKTKRNDFEMVIVGDGHARQEFEQLMPGAHFLGYQSGVTLAESFASADIFVFPSTTETFGLVTLEAMASGLTPVAAKMGGAIEIIQDGTSGLLAKPFDGADLAQKVEWLLDHPNYSRTMGEQAHLRAQEYRWESILGNLFTVYEDVIRQKKQQRLLQKAA